MHREHKLHLSSEENFRNLPALVGTELSPSLVHLSVHKLDKTVEYTLDVNAVVLLCTGLVNVTERHGVVIGKEK